MKQETSIPTQNLIFEGFAAEHSRIAIGSSGLGRRVGSWEAMQTKHQRLLPNLPKSRHIITTLDILTTDIMT